MEEILEHITSEVQSNIIIPGYSDEVIKDIAAMVLTIAFSVLRDTSADLVTKKK